MHPNPNGNRFRLDLANHGRNGLCDPTEVQKINFRFIVRPHELPSEQQVKPHRFRADFQLFDRESGCVVVREPAEAYTDSGICPS